MLWWREGDEESDEGLVTPVSQLTRGLHGEGWNQDHNVTLTFDPRVGYIEFTRMIWTYNLTREENQAVPAPVSPQRVTVQYSQRMLGFEVKHQGLSLIPPGFLQWLSEFFNSGITSTERRCLWGTYKTRRTQIIKLHQL